MPEYQKLSAKRFATKIHLVKPGEVVALCGFRPIGGEWTPAKALAAPCWDCQNNANRAARAVLNFPNVKKAD